MSKKPQQKTQRVRLKDAEDSIYHPNQVVIQSNELDHDIGREPIRDVIVYTSIGYHDYLDGDDNPILGDDSSTNPNNDVQLAEDRSIAFAKEVSIDGRNSNYYVKKASNGRFFDPWGIDEGRHNKQLRHTGKGEFEYHTVNKRSFTFYVAFLRTHNTAQLRNAERENF